MKKFAAVIAVAVLVAFAAPAFAAINPFMDVPMNHWAYDAIGQLAAHGILSGYPDGTYKGKQPTTRYEMASALARALAVVDMTKASKQDVEMLKRLVIEFKDELEALGVRVDDLDERVSLLESRLGGWKLSGRLRLDIKHEDDENKAGPNAKGASKLENGRLWIERYFGDPDNPMHFYSEMDGSANLAWNKFYVDIPFFGGTTLTAGRFGWNMEDDYYIDGNTYFAGTYEVGAYYGLGALLTDRNINGLGITKNFGLGNFRAYVTHVDKVDYLPDNTFGAWELMMAAHLQFTEQVGFDLGAQIFAGDNAATEAPLGSEAGFNDLWTIFAGLRFNFMDGVALRGIFYHQQSDVDKYDGVSGKWVEDPSYDDANHWRIALDVSQDVLKFTNAWLEYGQVDVGFTMPKGGNLGLSSMADLYPGNFMKYFVPDDLKYFRIALGQNWTPKVSTHLFYYNYDFDKFDAFDAAEYGLGVAYKYNDNVSFGLNYKRVDWDSKGPADEDHILFRTQVVF